MREIICPEPCDSQEIGVLSLKKCYPVLKFPRNNLLELLTLFLMEGQYGPLPLGKSAGKLKIVSGRRPELLGLLFDLVCMFLEKITVFS